MVTFIPCEDFEKVPNEFTKFTSIEARDNFNVDAYSVVVYPENHKKRIITQSDTLYWRGLFGKTRMNRAKKQFGKGILQVNFK